MTLPTTLHAGMVTYQPYGVQLKLFASDPGCPLQVRRAPDDGAGGPNVALAEELPALPVGVTTFTEETPNDGLRRHYQVRHARPDMAPSAWTCWRSATPVPLAADAPAVSPTSPVMREVVSATATAGTLAVEVADPQCRLVQLLMAAQVGEEPWGSWYDVRQLSAALVDKHASKVRYTATYYDQDAVLRTLERVVPVGQRPEANVTGIDVTFSAGDVPTLSVGGDADTVQIVVNAAVGAPPADPGPIYHSYLINGRTGYASLFYQTVGQGEDLYVKVAGVNAFGVAGPVQTFKFTNSAPSTVVAGAARAILGLDAAGIVEAGKVKETSIDSNAVTTPKILAGAVTAVKISVANLSAIKADLGDITAGLIRNADGTAGIRVSAGYSLAGATRYVDLDGSSGYFIFSAGFKVTNAGVADFSGTVTATSFHSFAATSTFGGAATVTGTATVGNLQTAGYGYFGQQVVAGHGAGSRVEVLTSRVDFFTGGTRTGFLEADAAGLRLSHLDRGTAAPAPGAHAGPASTSWLSTLSGLGLAGYGHVTQVDMWSDDTRGGAHQHAADSAGALYHRYGTRAGGWGSWLPLAHVVVSASAPSGAAPQGTLWVQY